MNKYRIFVDIDDTICKTDGCDYRCAKPMQRNIAKVNRLYDEGNEITMWTARGTKTGIDWKKLTEKQLKEWNVQYHHLVLGKPAFDVFIDDKVLNVERWTGENIQNILKKKH